MPSFGARSRERLETCHPNLQQLASAVVKAWDCSVIEGARSDERQALLFQTGQSKLDGVNRRSKHQTDEDTPLARAIDLAPYYADELPKIPWSTGPLNVDANTSEEAARQNLENLRRWYAFGGFVCGLAFDFGLRIVWGGDWDGDHRHHDQKFHDLPHFELVD